MPVKIRLQRHGKKGKPFYHIVSADSRSKRDGRFIEKIGSYNPNTNPATIEMDVDRAVYWLENGAQPTDTARTLLSYKGAMMKKHLNGGVAKGAFTQEVADARYAEWLSAKESKITGKVDGLAASQADARAKALAAEKEISEKRAAEIAAKNAPAVEAVEATEENTEDAAE